MPSELHSLFERDDRGDPTDEDAELAHTQAMAAMQRAADLLGYPVPQQHHAMLWDLYRRERDAVLKALHEKYG